jgi:hypothetical protein
LKKLLFALSALLFADATPALAAPDSGPWLMTDARFASVRLPIHRMITSQSVLIPGFVAATPNQTGLPCIGCVNSSDPANTLGLSIPDNYIQSGVATNYFFNFTALSYNGMCTTTISATMGSTVLFSQQLSVSVSADSSNDVYITGVLNDFSGTALLTAKVVCGKHSAVANATLYLV